MRSYLVSFLAACLVLVVALPAGAQRKRLAGRARVEIFYDSLSIPHIFGRSDEAAM